MRLELRIPEVGESITEVEVGDWLKPSGAAVKKDEPVVTLDSEKATVELPSPDSGTIVQVLKQKGEVAKVGEVIGYLDTEAKPGGAPEPKPAAAAKAAPPAPSARPDSAAAEPRVMPAAQVALAERGLQATDVEGTGPGGRILKEDVLRHAEKVRQEPAPHRPATAAPAPASAPAVSLPTAGPGEEEVVPMSRLRRTVAERLVQAQHTAALLTTFNELDMTQVLALRK